MTITPANQMYEIARAQLEFWAERARHAIHDGKEELEEAERGLIELDQLWEKVEEWKP